MYKPATETHTNGIPHQQKTVTPPSPLLKKLLNQRDPKIELFQLARTQGPTNYKDFLIFCSKYIKFHR